MQRVKRLLVVLGAAIAISSLLSHAATHWLKIRATPVFLRSFGPQNGKPSFVDGSSLAFEGLNWSVISDTLCIRIQNFSALGSSPCEWEVLQRQTQDTSNGFVVVSPYDLNEHWLCDFRADIVPLSDTIRDLMDCDSEWSFSKRILSQYPLFWVRILYPTAGRSEGVMTGVRAQLKKLASRKAGRQSEKVLQLVVGGNDEIKEAITGWSVGRFQRRLALMRAACDNRHSFASLKRRSLLRLLQETSQRGNVALVVLPVSPAYQKEFLNPEVRRQFEETLAGARRCSPKIQIIRLDHVLALNNDDLYYDLVHLNLYGRRIATTAFLDSLERLPEQP